jgi:hypothetical protein
MAYAHRHYYFNLSGAPWTVRLQGDNTIGEIYTTKGKITEETTDINWHAIRSPFEEIDAGKYLPEYVISGIETWADTGAMMSLRQYLKHNLCVS